MELASMARSLDRNERTRIWDQAEFSFLQSPKFQVRAQRVSPQGNLDCFICVSIDSYINQVFWPDIASEGIKFFMNKYNYL